MKLSSFLIAAGSFLKKILGMKSKPQTGKRLFQVTDPDNYKRYILADSKYEALERIRQQDDYKHSVIKYKVKSKNF